MTPDQEVRSSDPGLSHMIMPGRPERWGGLSDPACPKALRLVAFARSSHTIPPASPPPPPQLASRPFPAASSPPHPASAPQPSLSSAGLHSPSGTEQIPLTRVPGSTSGPVRLWPRNSRPFNGDCRQSIWGSTCGRWRAGVADGAKGLPPGVVCLWVQEGGTVGGKEGGVWPPNFQATLSIAVHATKAVAHALRQY